MEKKGTRMFRSLVDSATNETNWNIVELEPRRQLRRAVHTLITLSNSPLVTTSEIQQHLRDYMATFGFSFSWQLVRALKSGDQQRRENVVWLLTLLNDEATIPLLQHMSQDRQLARAVRLSAALALAGMGATVETRADRRRERRYAIS